MSLVEFTREADIVRIRLNNGPVNVINMEVARALSTAVADASASARALVVGGGPKFFSNGLDLAWALALDRTALRETFQALCSLVLLMLETPIPLVGVMRGHAVGAGKTLFSACDHRIGATGRVLIGMPETRLGVPNPYFADQLMRLLVSDAAASELIYSGELVTAERAAALGLVNELGDPAEVEARALERARAMAAIPSRAFAISKHMRTERLCATIRGGFPAQLELLLDAWFGEEAQRLLRAAADRVKRPSA